MVQTVPPALPGPALRWCLLAARDGWTGESCIIHTGELLRRPTSLILASFFLLTNSQPSPWRLKAEINSSRAKPGIRAFSQVLESLGSFQSVSEPFRPPA